MPNCQFLAEDIKTCQKNGKLVTISLGGATGSASFTSADQASAFGDTIWNVFLGGKNGSRPFGDAELDGYVKLVWCRVGVCADAGQPCSIDLDIEGGSTLHFDAFIKRIRDLAKTANKKVYISGAPQCVFPDSYMSP